MTTPRVQQECHVKQRLCNLSNCLLVSLEPTKEGKATTSAAEIASCCACCLARARCKMIFVGTPSARSVHFDLNESSYHRTGRLLKCPSLKFLQSGSGRPSQQSKPSEGILKNKASQTPGGQPKDKTDRCGLHAWHGARCKTRDNSAKLKGKHASVVKKKLLHMNVGQNYLSKCLTCKTTALAQKQMPPILKCVLQLQETFHIILKRNADATELEGKSFINSTSCHKLN
eukprot:567182-Amphidinium_carterae.2